MAKVGIIQDGRTYTVDIRATDGYALALQFQAPLFIAETLMKELSDNSGSEGVNNIETTTVGI
jgi:bifunctional DNase/RNase